MNLTLHDRPEMDCEVWIGEVGRESVILKFSSNHL